MTEQYMATLSVIENCNLDCVFCQHDFVEEAPSLEDIKKTLDVMREQGVDFVSFGGTEPFLRDDFVDILEHTDRKGFKVKVNTNGTLLDEDSVERISDMEMVELRVNMEAAERKLDEKMRGAQVYERTVNNLELLSEYGVPTSVGVVASRMNRSNIPELIDMVHSLGVKWVHIDDGARKDMGDIELSREEMSSLMEDIDIEKRDQPGRYRKKGCDYSFMSVSYTGDVMVRNEDGEFNRVGNIEDSVEVIRDAMSRTSPCESCDRFAKFECDAFHNICAKDVKLGMW